MPKKGGRQKEARERPPAPGSARGAQAKGPSKEAERSPKGGWHGGDECAGATCPVLCPIPSAGAISSAQHPVPCSVPSAMPSAGTMPSAAPSAMLSARCCAAVSMLVLCPALFPMLVPCLVLRLLPIPLPCPVLGAAAVPGALPCPHCTWCRAWCRALRHAQCPVPGAGAVHGVVLSSRCRARFPAHSPMPAALQAPARGTPLPGAKITPGRPPGMRRGGSGAGRIGAAVTPRRRHSGCAPGRSGFGQRAGPHGADPTVRTPPCGTPRLRDTTAWDPTAAAPCPPSPPVPAAPMARGWALGISAPGSARGRRGGEAKC